MISHNMTFLANILIQHETLCFPRTRFGANILARSLISALGKGRNAFKTRSGRVPLLFRVFFFPNHRLRPCRNAGTVKTGFPHVRACAHAPGCARMRRNLCSGVPAFRLSVPSFLNPLKRKEKRVGNQVVYPERNPERSRNAWAMALVNVSNLLKNNKKRGFYARG